MVITRSLCLSLVISVSNPPRLSISIDRQFNPIIKDLNSAQKFIDKESLATSICQDFTWRPHWRNNDLRSLVSPKTRALVLPCTPGQISRTRFILRGEGSVTSQILGTKKNLVLQDPKFRTNKNFLKYFTNDCVFLYIAMFDLMFVVWIVLTCVCVVDHFVNVTCLY